MVKFATFAKAERAGWADATIVAAYVERFGPVVDAVAARLVAQVAPEGRHILDLCCGHGALTAALADAGARVTGLDFSPEMLAIARKHAPGIEFVEGDATTLQFRDGAFDSVISNFGMMHIPDQPAALAEICRVLRPGGRFLMATWAAPDRSPAFGAAFGTFRALGDFSGAAPQPDLFAFSRPDDARKMMAAAGLTMIAHEDIEEAWVLRDPSELFDIFNEATVGAKMLISGQTPETVALMRTRMTEIVAERHADGNCWRVPVVVSVIEAECA
ncbi:methyltransferase domain-containing protein [Psychromarinibacter sp. C21-152]|uniref:Methyltransferase domain-containing protein n=1 Tax=Psychromarinibacter sediminicola TaxID=3033385 RepID=A0AAE3NUV4_9RHOB|nr:methyltransferase domain-containing protein [Psychromarinibacter sediminicola]MDF0602069.1 methyltransferase domain-containing protein [Psychromarinibacter sediminicola]